MRTRARLLVAKVKTCVSFLPSSVVALDGPEAEASALPLDDDDDDEDEDDDAVHASDVLAEKRPHCEGSQSTEYDVCSLSPNEKRSRFRVS